MPTSVSVEDRAYLEQRAEAHLELAAKSTHPGVVKAHYALANLYLDRLYAAPESGGPDALFRHWRYG